MTLTASQRRIALHEFSRLRKRFAPLQNRAERLLADANLALPEMQHLARLAAEVESLCRLIAAELTRIDSEPLDVLPTQVLDELVERCEQVAMRLEHQQRLCTSTVECAAHLHAATVELIAGEAALPARLQNVARRVLVSVESAMPFAALFPEPELSLEPLIGSCCLVAVPRVYCRGILTARLIAYTIADRPLWRDRAEELIIAALLQDAGLLVLDTVHGVRSAPIHRGSDRMNVVTTNRLKRQRPGVYQQHPSVSAGLAAGLREFSSSLPAMIANHHERLDGTGFPRGRHARQLNETSRLLAVAVLFVEAWDLLSGQIAADSFACRASNEAEHPGRSTGRCADDAHDTVLFAAARLVWDAARRSEVDMRLASWMLQRIDRRLPDCLNDADHPANLLPAALLKPGTPRLDGKHALAAPHFASPVRRANTNSQWIHS